MYILLLGRLHRTVITGNRRAVFLLWLAYEGSSFPA
jgi:hypothetical protein